MKISRIIISALIVLLLAGCGYDRGVSKQEIITAIADEYFKAFQNNDFEKALALYSPKFFAQTPKEKWAESLKKVKSQLGDLSAYELIESETIPYYGQDTLYLLVYKVTYSNFSAQEILGLAKPLFGKIQIVRHIIISKGL